MTDPMSDTVLDRELEALLQVEPSADFLARTRMRLADAPASPWFANWRLAAVGAALAAVAVVLTVSLWDRGGTADSVGAWAAPPAVTTQQRPVASPPPAATSSPERAVIETGRGRRTNADRAAAGPVRREEPSLDRSPFAEVLVPPDQRRTIDALLAGLSRGALATPPLEASTEEESSVIRIDPIVIEDVVIVASLE